MSTETAPLVVAAVDLGSNSFHAVIAGQLGGDLQIIDRMREPVCLAAGLDATHRLTDEVQAAALASLERIGQRVRQFKQDHVRAVGTNTFRLARNAGDFRARSQRALGHPIEIISGQEEARLIYVGVAHSLPADTAPRLVVDIGGGSTEIILGEGFEVVRSHSLFMGCVGWSQRFFPGGELRKEQFQSAELAAGLELAAIETRLRGLGWNACIGASGTILAIQDLVQAVEGSNTITPGGLKRLRKELIAAGRIAALALPDLKPDRARVLPGGLAILTAAFKALDIESMSSSPWALREGLLYDLVGRMRHEDARDRTIRRLVQLYRVDRAQAERVARTALALLAQLPDGWAGDRRRAQQYLVWASRLLEIGLTVSFTGFHKHGAYLVLHSEMPGFSRDEQRVLAALVRSHRRKLTPELFAGVLEEPHVLVHLAAILRLATLLNRGRGTTVNPTLAVTNDGAGLCLTFAGGWRRTHPLTAADLDQEAGQLAAVGLPLEVHEGAAAAALSPET